MGAENGATRMPPIVEPLSDVGGREATFIGAILGETETEVPEFRKGCSPPGRRLLSAQVELGRRSVRGPSRLCLIRVSLTVPIGVLIACRTEARL